MHLSRLRRPVGISPGVPLPFTPRSLSGLKLWLAADRIAGLSDGDPVTTWSDLSGQGNNATQGTGAAKPPPNSNVKAHYVGKLLSGADFDSSRKRGRPFTFDIGQGRVIRGWDEGISTMSKGEKSVFTIAPEYAYGAAGAGGVIPPNVRAPPPTPFLSVHPSPSPSPSLPLNAHAAH